MYSVWAFGWGSENEEKQACAEGRWFKSSYCPGRSENNQEREMGLLLPQCCSVVIKWEEMCVSHLGLQIIVLIMGWWDNKIPSRKSSLSNRCMNLKCTRMYLIVQCSSLLHDSKKLSQMKLFCGKILHSALARLWHFFTKCCTLPEHSQTCQFFFLFYWLINRLVYRMLEPEVTSSNCLFCSTSSPKHECIQLRMAYGEKQQIFTFEKVEPENVWHF